MDRWTEPLGERKDLCMHVFFGTRDDGERLGDEETFEPYEESSGGHYIWHVGEDGTWIIETTGGAGFGMHSFRRSLRNVPWARRGDPFFWDEHY